MGGGLATLAGGNGDKSYDAGGGAAAGPAIFVNTGFVTATNSGAHGSSATPGVSGGGTATAGTADATPVFNYLGNVNASTAQGPLPTVLSNTTPQIRRRARRAVRGSAGRNRQERAHR
jgi:hypothetical protein